MNREIVELAFCIFLEKCKKKTRMHSSRMRTVHCSGRLMGVCLPEEVCLPWGSGRRGVSAQEGVSAQGVYTPLWTAFFTCACENITFLKLRLRTVIILCVIMANIVFQQKKLGTKKIRELRHFAA